MRTAALLAVFALLLLVRLAGAGLIDYDEAAYAQAAHEMLARGDWLAPSLNGEPFFEKPPLLYWGQMLGYRAFGVGAFGARIGNALAALGVLAAVYGISRRALTPSVARLGVLVLGSSLAFFSLGRVALTDIWLLLCIVLCLGSLHRAVEDAEVARSHAGAWFAAACASAGFAMLAKGAIGALLPAAAGLLHLASLRRLSLLLRPAWWLPGGLLLLGIGLSWYLLLGATRPDGFAFMTELFLEHHLARFRDAKEGHRGPVFYYLPVLIVGLAPWSPLVPLALARRLGAGSERERWLRLMGLLAVVTLAFFSVAATKLPHYVLPAFPGLALLVADRLAGAGSAPGRRALAASAAAAAALCLVLAAGLAAAPAIAAALPGWLGESAEQAPGLAFPLRLGAGLPAAVLAACATAGVVWSRRRDGRRLAWGLGAGALVVWALLAWGVMPRWDAHFQRPLRELAVSACADSGAGERLLLVGLRRKPSLVFYTGCSTDYASPRKTRRIAAWLAGPPPRLALASEPHFGALSRALPLEALRRDTGFVLFRAAAAAAAPVARR